MTIWKFQLEIAHRQTIKVPTGAVPLCVQVQAGVPCLWMKVEAGQPIHDLHVVIAATGEILPDDLGDFDYTGTAQTCGGNLVWHVFVERK